MKHLEMTNDDPSVSRRCHFRDSWLLKTGLLLFVFGCGPLLAIIAAAGLGLTSDPNPNPVGFGILAFLTFWPSLGLMLLGAATVTWHNSTAQRP